MQPEVKTICFGSVNCYLIKNSEGFILIDTGLALHRQQIEKELNHLGCCPGRLKLIILTHGDFDHAGNAAYFRHRYAAPIAIHRNESGVVEKGDMLLSRKGHRLKKILSKIILKIILPWKGLGKFEKFRPDFYIEDGFDLSQYGFDARVLYIPGHSQGSIGIITADGNLFCGDFFINGSRPSLNPVIDDTAAANATIENLKNLKIATIYPGHGSSFVMAELLLPESP